MRGTPATETERAAFRRLPLLLIPGCNPAEIFRPTPEELAEQAANDTELQRLEREIAEIEREHPAMAARENARLEREEREIRERVFGRGTTKGQ